MATRRRSGTRSGRYGLRNPFTFGIQPGTGRSSSTTSGENTWEEINDGVAGRQLRLADLRGPLRDQQPDSVHRVHEPFLLVPARPAGRARSRAATSTTRRSPQFPADYVGKYFFADYCAGWIKYIDPTASGNPPTVTTSRPGSSRPVDIVGGYDGNLYYLARGSGRYGRRLQGHVHGQQRAGDHAGPRQPADLGRASGDLHGGGVGRARRSRTSGRSNNVDIGGANSAVLHDRVGRAWRRRRRSSGAWSPTRSGTGDERRGDPDGDDEPAADGHDQHAAAAERPTTRGDTITYAGSGSDPEDGTLPASAPDVVGQLPSRHALPPVHSADERHRRAAPS